MHVLDGETLPKAWILADIWVTVRSLKGQWDQIIVGTGHVRLNIPDV